MHLVVWSGVRDVPDLDEPQHSPREYPERAGRVLLELPVLVRLHPGENGLQRVVVEERLLEPGYPWVGVRVDVETWVCAGQSAMRDAVGHTNGPHATHMPSPMGNVRRRGGRARTPAVRITCF